MVITSRGFFQPSMSSLSSGCVALIRSAPGLATVSVAELPGAASGKRIERDDGLANSAVGMPCATTDRYAEDVDDSRSVLPGAAKQHTCHGST